MASKCTLFKIKCTDGATFWAAPGSRYYGDIQRNLSAPQQQTPWLPNVPRQGSRPRFQRDAWSGRCLNRVVLALTQNRFRFISFGHSVAIRLENSLKHLNTSLPHFYFVKNIFLFIYFLAALHGMQDLRFPKRDQTHGVSATELTGKPNFLIFRIEIKTQLNKLSEE